MFMELGSAVISFLIGYYALKAYKASSERALLFLHFGFVILGVSMLLRVVTTAYITIAILEESLPKPVLGVAYIIYPLIELIAYAMFAVTYTYQTKISTELIVPAQIPLLRLFSNPVLELLSTVLLAYVMVRSMMNFVSKRSNSALLVSLGFLFIFLGQVFFLFAPFDVTLFVYLLGHFFNLIGFLSLLIMLVQVSHSE